jgi:hypothetical protein
LSKEVKKETEPFEIILLDNEHYFFKLTIYPGDEKVSYCVINKKKKVLENNIFVGDSTSGDIKIFKVLEPGLMKELKNNIPILIPREQYEILKKPGFKENIKNTMLIPIAKDQYDLLNHPKYLGIFKDVPELVMYLNGDFISFTDHNPENRRMDKIKEKLQTGKLPENISKLPVPPKMPEILKYPFKSGLSLDKWNTNKPMKILLSISKHNLDNLNDDSFDSEDLLLVHSMLAKISNGFESLLESKTLQEQLENFMKFKSLMDLNSGDTLPITSFLKKGD